MRSREKKKTNRSRSMVDQEQGGRGGAVGDDHVAIVEREFDVEGRGGAVGDDHVAIVEGEFDVEGDAEIAEDEGCCH